MGKIVTDGAKTNVQIVRFLDEYDCIYEIVELSYYNNGVNAISIFNIDKEICLTASDWNKLNKEIKKFEEESKCLD